MVTLRLYKYNEFFQKCSQVEFELSWNMLKLVAFLAIFVLATTAQQVIRHRYELNAILANFNRQSRGGRIVGGSDSTIESHPYIIALQFRGRHSCGGSIINENTILSAAHCTL